MKFRTNVRDTVLLLVLGYYLPVILIWLDILTFRPRYVILEFMTVVFILYAWRKKKSLKDLGIRTDTLKSSLLWNGIISIVITIIILFFYFSGKIRPQTEKIVIGFYIFYVLLSSPSQEFIYRGLLFNELNNLSSKTFFQIIFSAFTYSFLHIIFNDLITIFVTLFMGIVWGIIYYFRPNLIGVSMSHAILGLVSLIVGLV